MKIRFYTSQEEKRMLEVYKTSKNQAQASVVLAKEFKRSLGSVQVKLSNLLRQRAESTRKSKEESKGVTIPQGFTFDIKPNRAVMYPDHVRLYF
jgi:hypothetical protein